MTPISAITYPLSHGKNRPSKGFFAESHGGHDRGGCGTESNSPYFKGFFAWQAKNARHGISVAKQLSA
jgi:hypothetical protein